MMEANDALSRAEREGAPHIEAVVHEKRAYQLVTNPFPATVMVPLPLPANVKLTPTLTIPRKLFEELYGLVY